MANAHKRHVWHSMHNLEGANKEFGVSKHFWLLIEIVLNVKQAYRIR